MPTNEIPDSFFSWVVTGVGTIIVTLVGTVTALWRINESKNAAAILDQSKQIATIEGELKVVRDHGIICEQARLECITDRAVLSTKCDIFEKRLTILEKDFRA
jgi:hypothetical protein